MTTRHTIMLHDLTTEQALLIIEMAHAQNIACTRQEVEEPSNPPKPDKQGSARDLLLSLLADGPKPLSKIKVVFKQHGFAPNTAAAAISALRLRGQIIYQDRVARLP